jgi:hypothetical protein
MEESRTYPTTHAVTNNMVCTLTQWFWDQIWAANMHLSSLSLKQHQVVLLGPLYESRTSDTLSSLSFRYGSSPVSLREARALSFLLLFVYLALTVTGKALFAHTGMVTRPQTHAHTQVNPLVPWDTIARGQETLPASTTLCVLPKLCAATSSPASAQNGNLHS